MHNTTEQLAEVMATALLPTAGATPTVRDDGTATGLPSCYDVTGFAAASIGLACAEAAALSGSGHADAVIIDRELASRWFDMTIRPLGWSLPPVWDSIAGVYATQERWIRLHTNAPQHRAAALRVLGCAGDRDAVARNVALWDSFELESALVDARGCAAVMLTRDEWLQHPQGRAVAAEPLIAWSEHGARAQGAGAGVVTGGPVGGPAPGTAPDPASPLASPPASPPASPLRGLRVLDCTRVLAGPVCTRLLAGFGAQVLRIDPPGWSEAVVEPEVTPGKRLATLDLRDPDAAQTFAALLAEADIFIHGYRADALERLGFGDERRRDLNSALIDVALCAYGWSGPWKQRRGFDSLVQMSAGIADEGMRCAGSDRPTPLPVQALDHGTGYLMAAAALRGLRIQAQRGTALSARLSLARTAEFLAGTIGTGGQSPLPELRDSALMAGIEETSWGPASRVRFPIVSGCPRPHWDLPARALHSDAAMWT